MTEPPKCSMQYKMWAKLHMNPDGRSAPSNHVTRNLYVVATAKLAGKPQSTIEDFFPDIVKVTKLNGKSFNPSKKGFNSKTEYGKYLFAEHVIKKNRNAIDFTTFDSTRDRLSQAITAYKP